MHVKGLRPGEGIGDLPLIVGQQIDGEAAIGLGETGDTAGPVVEADQDQRRVERFTTWCAFGTLTVTPTGPRSSPADVTTVTPDAKQPRAFLNSIGSTMTDGRIIPPRT